MGVRGRMRAFQEALMIGAVVCAVVLGMPVTAGAQATCRIYGQTWMSGGGDTIEFEGYTSAGDSFVTGTILPLCPIVNSDDWLQAESWVDGRQPNRTFCNVTAAINDVCYANSYIMNGYPYAGGAYVHTGTLYHNWCARTKHWLVNANGNGNWYGRPDTTSCHNFGQSAQEECEADNNLWVEDDWYPEGGYCEANQDPESPILIPLTRSQAYKLTSVEGGVLFDHDGDGVLEQTAWTEADSKLAFLAIDRNGNGLVDNGTELFGNNTLPGVRNGFVALTDIMPINGPNGYIDDDDPVYPRLLLWEDRNHNGVSEPAELRPASTMLTRIGVGYSKHNRRDGDGNQFRYEGWAEIRTAPGKNEVQSGREHDARQIRIYDVFFQVQR